MTIDVQHDPARQRFFTVLDGHEAYLQYAPLDDGRVDFRSTFSPPELRGRGVAAALVSSALAWARAEGKDVVPSCSYVKSYLEKESSA